MDRMTPKENFLALAKGEIPQDVIFYNMGMPTFNGQDATRTVSPGKTLFPMDTSHNRMWDPTNRTTAVGHDIWGVPYVANASTNWQSLPEPNNFILKDVTEWKKVVKAPTLPDVDWADMAAADIAASKIDRNVTAMFSGGGYSPFQQLIAFMGFNEGLCALYEEPEACVELLNYLTDFYVPIIEKVLDYYKPDVFSIADDTASKYNPFFSPEIYHEIFMPQYDRLLKPARERGIYISYHNCGRCEDFMDDMVAVGTNYWDPCQVENDLLAVKEKYPNLVLLGCWDLGLLSKWPEVDEAEIRQSVRDTIDKFAPGGRFAFRGRALGSEGDTVSGEVCKWIEEEVWEYGRDYYSRHK